LLVAVAYVGFRSLQYTEFGVLKYFLFDGGFRRVLRGNIYLKEYEQSLAAAMTLEECWLALRNTCREADFSYVALRVDGKFFEDALNGPRQNPAAYLQIALSSSDSATFSHDPTSPELAMLIAPFFEGLRAKLSATGALAIRKVVPSDPLSAQGAAAG
jgi:hypothetical protein